ncbi:MAG: HAD-IA family hydrolase [Vicinamibacterales bacterium]|nr:HAD-IA family hydrolase [Vicinamibacterales bacterium]
MPGYSTVLFDLDGTLIDSTELIMTSFRHTMRTHLDAVPSEAEWRSGFGTPLRPQLARFARDAAEVEVMVETYRSCQRLYHDRLVSAFPDIVRVVARLAASQIPLAIVTSKNREATLHGLRHCGLEAYFDVVVTSDDVTRHKPEPAPVIEALARLDRPAHGTLFIGDSPFDCMAGHAAGVSTAAVRWGPFACAELERHEPDHWLERPADILDLTDSEPTPLGRSVSGVEDGS